MDSEAIRPEPSGSTLKPDIENDDQQTAEVPTAPIRDALGKKRPAHQDREIFDLTSLVDNRMVRNYEPKFLAKGGEHIVYEIPGRQDVIVKVDARIIRKSQEHNASLGRPLDSSDPDIMPVVEAKLKEDRQRLQQFREHFGREHVPNIKQDYIQVPITPQMTYILHNNRPPVGWKEAKEVWSIVRVQKRVPEVIMAGTLGVQFGYMEMRSHESNEQYERLTRAFVDGQSADDFNPNELDKTVLTVAGILSTAEKNPACATALRDFVSKAISYAKKTGEILDLAGKDNVVFFEKDGVWDYKMIDALYGGETDMLKLMEPILRKVASGVKLDAIEQNKLLNTVNFVRGINGLAARLGVSERVEMVPDDLKGKIDFFSAIAK